MTPEIIEAFHQAWVKQVVRATKAEERVKALEIEISKLKQEKA